LEVEGYYLYFIIDDCEYGGYVFDCCFVVIMVSIDFFGDLYVEFLFGVEFDFV